MGITLNWVPVLEVKKTIMMGLPVPSGYNARSWPTDRGRMEGGREGRTDRQTDRQTDRHRATDKTVLYTHSVAR